MASKAPLPQDRPARTDALRNRAKLLAAAEAVFTERGANASLDDIAKRAGVGIGTLYRHFPTREALLAAACEARLHQVVRSSQAYEAASSSTADTLGAFLEALVRHASAYRGLATSLGVVLQAGSAGCHATTEEGQRLLERAQRSGEIREDVDLDDIVCMATAISLAAQDDASKKRIPRLVAMFVDGLRLRTKREKR